MVKWRISSLLNSGPGTCPLLTTCRNMNPCNMFELPMKVLCMEIFSIHTKKNCEVLAIIITISFSVQVCVNSKSSNWYS
jgi:hypothetical protein